jgi:hypothetical protein
MGGRESRHTVSPLSRMQVQSSPWYPMPRYLHTVRACPLRANDASTGGWASSLALEWILITGSGFGSLEASGMPGSIRGQ